ncbi:LysR substrate-binding domain-containing protein [Microvirga puerhi]|uniref:LysR family transcriptional regulator n=1 Tax=Microvirga puerhi TaxID=2876078 RepID=A0ABS7VJH8_9HYPH|nr:LysR substrate-binding domain-containing protein [Microvirga puerhi]MBZ6075316.1 LysR family transcriptional regulator [Microvirga puerhi]
MSRSHLPSTIGLRVVAALAQYGTVSSAANALHLTQSAVSKQLKNVEAVVGMPLFDRTGQGLSPTQAGMIYIEQARIALGAMETAAMRVAALRSSQPAIRLHVLPILGDRWFMPRFSRFAERHPDIDVQFTTFAPTDTLEEADAVFRFGIGEWPGWRADYVLGRDVILVGSPQLIAKYEGIASIADILRYPLLEHLQTPLRWNDFAEACHLRDFTPARVTRFGYYSLVIRAAIGGQGLALVPRSLILDELAGGQLMNPSGLGFTSRNCYWLTTPDDRPPNASLAVLRDWILQEAQASEHNNPEGLS